MNRRQFLLNSIYTSSLFGVGLLSGRIQQACAAAVPLQNKILANLMLAGGPDFRHIFPPAYDPNINSFGHHYWKNRARAHGIGNSGTAWETRWENDFNHRTYNGVEFGIKKDCGWLSTMWDQGKLAIICNAIGSPSRDHEHALLVMDQGNLSSGPNDFSRSGWGGRLAQQANGNIVALTSIPRKFCFGALNNDINSIDNSNLISLSDSRKTGLYEFDQSKNPRYDLQGAIARSARAYYAALHQEMDTDSPFTKLLDHEFKIRQFGGLVSERLQTVSIPDKIKALYEGVPGINNGDPLLVNRSFGLQIRNLYDAIASNDLLSLAVASMDYGGWDSHEGQRNFVEYRFRDVFGTNMGYSALWQSLTDSDKQNIAIVISGEFGRQIRDNGGNGTDHGRGNIMLVAGDNVQGGVYGEMFPNAEILKLNDPNEYNPDIDGKTEFDHIYGSSCDWVSAGSSNLVFPNRANAIIETPNLFNNLFT